MLIRKAFKPKETHLEAWVFLRLKLGDRTNIDVTTLPDTRNNSSSDSSSSSSSSSSFSTEVVIVVVVVVVAVVV